MLKAIVTLLCFPLLAFFSIATVALPLSEAHAVRGAYPVVIINVSVCIALFCAYALPLRPRNWRWNFYLLSDFALIAGYIWLFLFALRGFRSLNGALPEIIIIPIVALILLLLAVLVFFLHIFAFRR